MPYVSVVCDPDTVAETYWTTGCASAATPKLEKTPTSRLTEMMRMMTLLFDGAKLNVVMAERQ